MEIRITRPNISKEEREHRIEQIKRAIADAYKEKGNK